MNGLVAVMDPNWKANAGGGGKGANAHYALEGTDAIALSYRNSEPWSDVGPALAFIWVTVDARREGDDRKLIAALPGFAPCAEFVWVKVDVIESTTCENARGERTNVVLEEPAYRPRAKWGMGQWEVCDHEYLMLCRRGGVDVKKSPRPRSVIYAPVGEHSEKPELAWTQVIEPIARGVLPRARRVEFNARAQRPGWGAVGRLEGETFPDGTLRPVIYRAAP